MKHLIWIPRIVAFVISLPFIIFALVWGFLISVLFFPFEEKVQDSVGFLFIPSELAGGIYLVLNSLFRTGPWCI